MTNEFEYRTTTGSAGRGPRYVDTGTSWSGFYDKGIAADQPKVPGGQGWELIDTKLHDSMLIWSWRRAKQTEQT